MKTEDPLRRSFSLRLVLGVAFGVAFVGVVYFALFFPVCEPIPRSELPVFESVSSLEERAASGEPFRKVNGRWNVCKSRLARAFFF
jgi:hypothetical protein